VGPSDLKQGGPSGPSSLSPGDKKAVKRLLLTVATLFACLWVGPAAVLSGILFGALTFVALYSIMTLVPGFDRVTKALGSMVDVAATVLAFLILGGTLTAAFGAATVGCLFTVMVTMKKLAGPKGVLDGLLARIQAFIRRKLHNVEEHSASGSNRCPAGERTVEYHPPSEEQPAEGVDPEVTNPDLQDQ